jgi:hypothetical protein
MRVAALACAALALGAAPALAQPPYLGEVRQVAFAFAPTGWHLCQGQRILLGDVGG